MSIFQRRAKSRPSLLERAPADPVTKMLTRAKQEYAVAERTVVGLQGQMAALLKESTSDHLGEILRQRIAERDAARQALEALNRTPRWQLEKQAATASELGPDK